MNKSNSRSDQNLLGAQPDVVRQTVDDSLLGRPHVADGPGKTLRHKRRSSDSPSSRPCRRSRTRG